MNRIDARGLACPEPVLRVQNALRGDAAGVEVTVDNMASVENIRRFAAARGYAVEQERSGRDFFLRLKKA